MRHLESLDEKVARLSAKMRAGMRDDFLATLQARIDNFSQFMLVLSIALSYMQKWYEIDPNEVREVEIRARLPLLEHVSSVLFAEQQFEAFLSERGGHLEVYHVNDYHCECCHLYEVAGGEYTPKEQP